MRRPRRARVTRLPHEHAAVGREAVVRRDRDHVCAVGVGRVEHDREAEVRRQSRGDVDPGRAGVVRAVDAAVKLHEQPLGPGGGALEVVHAEVDRGRPRLLGQVVGDDALVAVAPRRAAVVGEPHAGGGDREREPVRIARPRRDRVHRQAAGVAPPARARRVLEQRPVELPRRAAVAAFEQHARVAAGPQPRAVLVAGDHPHALERLVAAPRQRDALRRLPLAAEQVVGEPDPRAPERRRDRGEQAAAAGSRIA